MRDIFARLLRYVITNVSERARYLHFAEARAGVCVLTPKITSQVSLAKQLNTSREKWRGYLNIRSVKWMETYFRYLKLGKAFLTDLRVSNNSEFFMFERLENTENIFNFNRTRNESSQKRLQKNSIPSDLFDCCAHAMYKSSFVKQPQTNNLWFKLV